MSWKVTKKQIICNIYTNLNAQKQRRHAWRRDFGITDINIQLAILIQPWQCFLQCLPSWNNAECAGSDTSHAWKMVASPRIYFKAYWWRESDPEADQTFDLRTYANGTWRPKTLALTPGRIWQQTATHGSILSRLVSTSTTKIRDPEVSEEIQEIQDLQPSTFVCNKCSKDCHTHIGLTSHKRRCKPRPWSMVLLDWWLPI